MLNVTSLHKTFNPGTVNANHVLRGVNLNMEDGEFVSVIGGNGAGKSTLLNVIAGVELPDAGQILLDGTDITWLPEHQRAAWLGRVFQDPMRGTAGDMSIAENLALAEQRGRRRGLSWNLKQRSLSRYSELVSQLELGLEERMNQRVRLLSGGQRQALTLLMATMQEPRLLLLDEHTAALDPKTAIKILAVTRKVVEQSQLTTLMITHNMQQAIDYGNRLIMMDAGKIILDIKGEAKRNLTVTQLLEQFNRQAGEQLASDSLLLNRRD